MTADESEEQINAHNRRLLWNDIAASLRGSHELLENAQGALEDLLTYGVERSRSVEYADQLQPLVDVIKRAANDADEQAAKP